MKPLIDPDTPLYSVTEVARRLNLHPQTLRMYDRKGIVSPDREGKARRLYSENHILRLERLMALTSEGVNLPGVIRILALEEEILSLKLTVQLSEEGELDG